MPYDGFGVHPRVCCPENIARDSICFESDPFCVNYVQPEYEDYPDYYQSPVLGEPLPTQKVLTASVVSLSILCSVC